MRGKIMAEYIVPVEDIGVDGAYFGYAELIRCRECRYAFEGFNKYVCVRMLHEFRVEPNSFCSWAERKEE